MRRIKKIIFIGLLAGALTFPVVLCPGQEKQENTSKKETPKKSTSESAKRKVQEKWQKAKKDTKEAGRELKKTGKQFSDSAKKESKKMGETLKKAGKDLGESLRGTFQGVKKLFRE
jgi:F0F1-type ATP synthase membrane subunit b/b'